MAQVNYRQSLPLVDTKEKYEQVVNFLKLGFDITVIEFEDSMIRYESVERMYGKHDFRTEAAGRYVNICREKAAVFVRALIILNKFERN